MLLESAAVQLYVVAAPEAFADSVHIADPPERRADAVITLAFSVGSIAATRRAAETGGGQVGPPESQWEFLDCVHCDGVDPEGNVFQSRQPVP